MAITNLIRHIGNGLGGEIREFRSIVRRIRLTADSSAIGANFRKFGPSFGTYDFDDFVRKARSFYAMAVESDDAAYTIVQLKNNRIAVDYNGEVRGIFTKRGKPLAFFRPDYTQSGYVSKAAELDDFRHGRNILFS